ncbi:hypothetical protein [Conexibacter sp. CPCC 206217]|uniref:hypothetical protein n=1 Tax=Conexibacter sp. CPCC 206217 TaxID=3064574 RepID=UPI00271BA882|nr:hypothetical protein [Conexibacter sp. CPCC 206217]MDO8212168.1 hypothetical protein [Conexibacter sp. CPCC 206217]
MLPLSRTFPRSARGAASVGRRPTTSLAFALFVALGLGLTLVLALGTGPAAAARPAAAIVRVTNDSAQSPIRVTVAARVQDRLRVRLNGRRVDGVFVQASPGTRVGLLGANDGARVGENRLRVRVARHHGAAVSASRSVSLPGDAPVAGAGHDQRVFGRAPVQLSARSSRASRDGHQLAYRWRVVGAPHGARPRLRGADTATPRLLGDRHGRYALHLTVTQHRGAAVGADGGSGTGSAATPDRGRDADTVTIDVVPNDPPVGVQADTLANAAGDIVIAGRKVDRTGGGRDNPISYAVLDRATRAPQASGAVAKSADGLKTIQNAIRDNPTADSLVIVNSTAGIDAAQQSQFEDLIGSIGGGPLDDDARFAVTRGQPFSVVGVPTAPAGSLQSTFFSATALASAAGKPDGDLSGLLQFNAGIAEYGFVLRDYVSFSTDATTGAIVVGGTRYTSSLGAGKSGFHVLSLDSRTLGPTSLDSSRTPDRDEQVFETNSGDATSDAAALREMTNWLNVRSAPEPRFGNGSPLVIIQSIGRPRLQTEFWGIIGDRIRSLGGTMQTFNTLDGSGGYALVGRGPTRLDRLPVVEAAETSTQTSPREPARLVGMLSRGRDGAFSATLADPNGTVNAELMQVVYQPSRAFTPFEGRQQLANAWAAEQLRLIVKTDVRANYTRNYTSDWGDIGSRLDRLDVPRSVTTFTDADLEAVKRVLAPEIARVIEVKTFVANLQSPGDTAFASYLDLQRISEKIQAAVHPPDVTNRTNAAKVFQYGFLAVSKLVPGNPGGAAGLLASAFEWVSKQTGPEGSALLGPLQTRTTELQTDLLAKYEAARAGLRLIGLIVVSDPDKLATVADKSTSDPTWVWPEQDTLVRTAMRKGAKRYFYSQLLPLAFVQYHLTGPVRANDWYCRRSSTGYQAHVFESEPDSGQYVAIDRYREGPFRADTSARALGQADVTGRFASSPDAAKPPPASLMDPLFKPLDRDPATDNLGIDKPTFFERFFTTREEPVPFSYYC